MQQKSYKVWRPGAWIAALVLGVGVAMTADASGAERLEGVPPRATLIGGRREVERFFLVLASGGYDVPGEVRHREPCRLVQKVDAHVEQLGHTQDLLFVREIANEQ